VIGLKEKKQREEKNFFSSSCLAVSLKYEISTYFYNNFLLLLFC
jgi:hypothetical protein